MVTTRAREICGNCGSTFILEDEDGQPYCFICGRQQLTYRDYGRIGGLQTLLRHPPGYMKELGKRGGRPKTQAAPAPEVESKLKGGKLPNSIRELKELWRAKIKEGQVR